MLESSYIFIYLRRLGIYIYIYMSVSKRAEDTLGQKLQKLGNLNDAQIGAHCEFFKKLYGDLFVTIFRTDRYLQIEFLWMKISRICIQQFSFMTRKIVEFTSNGLLLQTQTCLK